MQILTSDNPTSVPFCKQKLCDRSVKNARYPQRQIVVTALFILIYPILGVNVGFGKVCSNCKKCVPLIKLHAGYFE